MIFEFLFTIYITHKLRVLHENVKWMELRLRFVVRFFLRRGPGHDIATGVSIDTGPTCSHSDIDWCVAVQWKQQLPILNFFDYMTWQRKGFFNFQHRICCFFGLIHYSAFSAAKAMQH